MIIGAGQLQVPAYEEARRMGIRTVSVDRNPEAPGMSLSDIARTVDTRDSEGILRVAVSEKIDAVMTLCTDIPMISVAVVNEKLGFPGPRNEVINRAIHKGYMRDSLKISNVPIPNYRRAKSIREVEKAAFEIGFPVILKPPLSSGSRGIFEVKSPSDISVGFDHTKKIAGEDSEILVEEVIDGNEVSVEVLSFNGRHHVIAITDKRTTGNPYWVELGHVEPSTLPDETQESIKNATCMALDSLGLMNSASHVEIKVGCNGPYIIEVGARLGGDYITTELVPRSTGVNMVRATIELAMGRTPNIEKRHLKGVAIRYIIPHHGIVKAISGLEAAKHLPGVKIVKLNLNVGDEVRTVTSSLDRPGFIIAEGSDGKTAEEIAIKARDIIIMENE